MAEEVKQETEQNLAAPEIQPVVQTTPEEKVKQDIVNMKQHLTNLEQDDKELYADEIKSLKAKIAASEAQLQQEAKNVVTNVETAEKTFREKYGNEILNIIEIVALAVIIYQRY
ncbi:hypothetical protein NXG27_00860 [Megasphaera paucivorans]|uniref:Uncharacterized protein n=1 Tax=Megasphaera paucivorans TaxID=349095 RepID=A0A1G9QCW3_9FIRM|nr:hypothetical protein [Megasphaera paucivorans]SDM08215.1 hypothetical protein SAMN05660299_00174 [Megasphaera paucivorans]